eukprot:gene25062-biopygen11965
MVQRHFGKDRDPVFVKRRGTSPARHKHRPASAGKPALPRDAGDSLGVRRRRPGGTGHWRGRGAGMAPERA